MVVNTCQQKLDTSFTDKPYIHSPLNKARLSSVWPADTKSPSYLVRKTTTFTYTI